MKIAAIDIGTNSVKYLLAETGCEKGPIILKDNMKITKLGEGLRRTGLISSSAFRRTTEAVNEFVMDAKKNRADDIRIVGTMALRTASNAGYFSDKLKELTKIETEILSGEEEANFSFLGAVSGFNLNSMKRYCTIDTGGGSTELVFAKDGKIVSRASLKTGALLLTEKVFSKDVVSEKDLDKADNELKRVFKNVKLPFDTQLAIGIGGNVTSMAAVFKKLSECVPQEIEGTELSEEEVKRQIEEYSKKNLEQRGKITGLDPKRADIILAGACIVRYAMNFCGCRKIVVSERGLRHGVLYRMAGREHSKQRIRL